MSEHLVGHMPSATLPIHAHRRCSPHCPLNASNSTNQVSPAIASPFQKVCYGVIISEVNLGL